MSKIRLSSLQRAYRLGYLCAFNKCQADLHALAADFDSQIASLQEEFSAIVRDIHRYRAIERSLDVKRDSDARLH